MQTIAKITKYALLVISVFFLILIFIPILLPGDFESRQRKYDELEFIAKEVNQYHVNNGIYPVPGDNFFNERFSNKAVGLIVGNSPHYSTDDFDSTIYPKESDFFIVSNWGGEWYNYYAYPSGVSTLCLNRLQCMSSDFGLKPIIMLSVFSGVFYFLSRLIKVKKV